MELFARLELVILDLDHLLGAIDLHRLHALSFWDALVVRAAADAGCRRLFTEDLQPGRRIEGVEIHRSARFIGSDFSGEKPVSPPQATRQANPAATSHGWTRHVYAGGARTPARRRR